MRSGSFPCAVSVRAREVSRESPDYQHPHVREALGEPAGAPYPRGHLIEATDESLLRTLRQR